MRLARVLALAFALPVLAACGPSGPPNFLVITLDTARADRFGFHGNRESLTPHADRLAEEATVFTNCVSPSGTTSPSHATMLTGLHPRSHGVRSNTGLLPEEAHTLAEMLQSRGYATGAFVSMKLMLHHVGLEQGFEAVSDPKNTPLEGGWTRAGGETTGLAQDWFERSAGDRRPFFAWLHYYEPHSPYRVTSRSQPALASNTSRYADGIDSVLFAIGGWMADPAERRAVISLYDGQVHEADTVLGDLLARLEASGQLANTVVVLASDHGQALGEHGHPGHGPALWHSVLHVPFLIWDARDRRGRRVGERVGLVDLTPTILELAGLPIPDGLEGRSLLPALRGEPLGDHLYLGEIRPPIEKRGAYIVPPPYLFAAYEGRYKLMTGANGPAFFDLDADPAEESPLTREAAPEVYDRLARRLEEYARQVPAAAPAAEVPESVRQGLRALGYAQ